METLQFISIEEALKNGNSNRNQTIKGDFIAKHVYANVNQMVEYILNKSYEDSEATFSYDDVENFYTYPEYSGKYANFEGGTEEDKETEIERLKDLLSDLYDSIEENPDKEEEIEANRDLISEEIEELENLEQEDQEVFEWWLVSDYLAGKLKQLGHPIITGENIWGRCTTGQAILLDYAITYICANMEILEGQKYEWK